MEPTADQIIKIKILFALFGQISGLHINLSKSELAITSSSPSHVQNLANIIGCKPQTFPIKYLGLPLSDKNLTRTDYLPVIDAVQKTLAGWRASLLSIGGRFILTNSVLAAIPQYFMSVFLLPKWVTRKIEQIRRKFFWHGHKNPQDQQKSLYMVNWSLATRPRKLGGLGLRDIQIANQALLMKWMWNWCGNGNEWWKEVTLLPLPSDKPWSASNGSPFWRNMRHVAGAFHSSVSHQIQNGKKTQFWHDNWAGKPLKLSYPNVFQQTNSKEAPVSQCVNDTDWIMQMQIPTSEGQNEKNRLMLQIQGLQMSHLEDEIIWLRHQAAFSVKSAYDFLSHTPSPHSEIASVWQIKAPLRIQIFAWLLLNNRLSTTDNLMRRGWHLPSICPMCNTAEETTIHLFQNCVMAKQIRTYIHAAFGSTHAIPMRYITNLSTQMLIDPAENKKARQWELATCFVIWRERCRRIFSDKEIPFLSIVREINLECKLCLTNVN